MHRPLLRALRILSFLLLLVTGSSAAESLSVTFTPSRTASGHYAPAHVIAVWIETSGGTFVKTIGDWSGTRRSHLTQWRAKAGTADTDAIMGATQNVYASRTVTWNMTAKSTGLPVANGVYKVWLEVVDDNNPPPGTVSQFKANRFNFSFTKDGVATGPVTVVDASGKFTGISYTYTGLAATTYGVTYNGNGQTGGTVPIDALTYVTGQTVTVKANSGELVRTGFAFTGWNTAANGSGTSFPASGAATFAMASANVVLYAMWSPTYSVTYQGNGSTGGSVPIDATAYATGQTVTVKANTGMLVRSGFTFSGWNTAAAGSGTSYPATGSATFTMAGGSVTLYAMWTAVATYAVTYDANLATGGSVPVDALAYATGQTVTVRANTGSLVRGGYAFSGWNTAADGSGTGYAASGAATFPMGTANVVLYAVWQPTFAVTYDGNGSTGGSVPVDNTAYASGQSVTVRTNSGSLVRAGFVFSGWNTAADGSGISYAASGLATFTMGGANVVLHARWTAVSTFTVIYDGNGATAGIPPTDPQSYVTGQVVTVLANTGILVRTGYLFAGWNTAANGSGIGYAADGSATFIMGSVDVVLYAVWAPAFAVTYAANGATAGTVPTDAAVYTSGQMVTVQGNTGDLVRSGWTFAGWNTAADGSGTTYAGSGSATFPMGSGPVTLYAFWTKVPTYTVIYDANGGTGGSVPVDATAYTAGQTVTVRANSGNLVRSGRVFTGWSDTADGSGARYAASGTVTFAMGSADVVLFALWALPAVTALSPASGSTDGGIAVTISGTDLTGTSAVTFGGMAATGVAVVDAGTVTCFTPAATAPGPVDVVVTTPAGSIAGGTFSYIVPGPIIDAVAPSGGSVAGGTAVTIIGTHFTGTTAVTFDGLAASGVVVVNDAMLTCISPAHAAGSVDVMVIAGGNAAISSSGYTYSADGGSAYVSFIPTGAGGSYAPAHVLAVWVEDANGTFIRTIGDWSSLRRDNLSLWVARSGADADAVMGATRSAMAPVNRLSWDLRDRAGQVVADGSYQLWIELVDENAPPVGVATVPGARRTHLGFSIVGSRVTGAGPMTQDGFTDLSIGPAPADLLGDFTASTVAEDQRLTSCGSGGIYALLFGSLTLLIRHRRRDP